MEVAKKIPITSETTLEIKTKVAQIFHTLAHEIKNPLNGLVANLRLIEEDLQKGDVKSALKIMDIAKVCTTRYDDIMERIQEAVNHSMSPLMIKMGDLISMKDLITQIGWILAAEMKEKTLMLKQYISPKVPKIIYGDQTATMQILVNLVHNAIKNSPPESAITIGYLPAPGQNFILTVTDSGKGIPADKLEVIFEPGMQLGNQEGGQGLGLAIAKNLVEKMNGTISVESNPREGATFTVILPLIKYY